MRNSAVSICQQIISQCDLHRNAIEMTPLIPIGTAKDFLLTEKLHYHLSNQAYL